MLQVRMTQDSRREIATRISSRDSHLRWPLARQADHHPTRYSIRSLRYWFPQSLLRQLHERLGRPLHILEVGVGGSDLPALLGRPRWIARWDGLDVNPARDGDRFYDDFIEADLEHPIVLPRQYDAIVLVHVLEHLFEPEAAMARLVPALHGSGLLIGGSPTMPAPLALLRQRWLRRKNDGVAVSEHRHLSVITPRRIRHFARERALDVDLLTGAFFLRSSGSCLENFRIWIRANMLWGAAFPSLGGELYFSLRKP